MSSGRRHLHAVPDDPLALHPASSGLCELHALRNVRDAATALVDVTSRVAAGGSNLDDGGGQRDMFEAWQRLVAALHIASVDIDGGHR